MISKLTGAIDQIQNDGVILDVNGVGYGVFLTPKMIDGYQIGQQASFYIHTHVREDHIHLYGFLDIKDQKCFLLLTKVQGISVKVALSILSALSYDQVYSAILASDVQMFCQIKGIGKKVAERIVRELKNAVPEDGFVVLDSHAKTTDSKFEQDAIEALVNLGYVRSNVEMKVKKIIKDHSSINLQNLITLALKELSA